MSALREIISIFSAIPEPEMRAKYIARRKPRRRIVRNIFRFQNAARLGSDEQTKDHSEGLIKRVHSLFNSSHNTNTSCQVSPHPSLYLTLPLILIDEHLYLPIDCFQKLSHDSNEPQEKEKEAVERRNPPLRLPRRDFSSPSVVSEDTSVRESMEPVLEEEHPCTSQLFSSTFVLRSSSLLETQPVTTRRAVSYPGTSPLL
jgi:hypothetical protein